MLVFEEEEEDDEEEVCTIVCFPKFPGGGGGEATSLKTSEERSSDEVKEEMEAPEGFGRILLLIERTIGFRKRKRHKKKCLPTCRW